MNRVTLRRVELEAAGACPEGMGLFEWLVDAQDRDDSVLIREWTQLHSIWLATRYPDLSVWLVSHGLIPSLSGADLTGAYLTGANLTGAYLTRANLSRADLTGADLYGVDLSLAYLTGANLTRAYLTRANLTGANLTGTNLARADLTRANLTGADLTRAYYPTGEVPEGWTRGADGYLSARRASRGPASTPHRRSGSARPCAAK